MTLLVLAWIALVLPPAPPADDFERLEGRALAAIPESPEARPRERLTLAELGALPNVLTGVRSPAIVVRTDRGNPSRLLVAPGFWAAPPAPGADPNEPHTPVPVLVIERFATFEAGGGAAPDRLAEGRDLLLFDGFCLDLDSGRIVPDGQGGDLAFVASGEGGPRLEAVGGAALFPLTRPPDFAAPRPGAPSPGRAILPGDYAGRFLLRADGGLSGTLDLAASGRSLSGRFRSDQTGTSYEVTGEVEPGPDPAARFAIQFPRSRQEYRARLFSDGKNAMAGFFLLIDRERPFYALRSGGDTEPDAADAP